jgi:hypothetical protein
VNWVNANHPIPSHINLDINNDGECDFITFVVFGPVGAWNDLLWPHKWSLFTYNVSINGKYIWDYNFELDGTTTYFNNAVFAHEGFHVFGAPDLYHYDWDYRDLKAVGQWDVMDQSLRPKPQSMSAYMKYKYGNWISDLPVTDINKTYEVYPFYNNDGSNPDKPIIYSVPMESEWEYSVVEYRKKTGVNYDSNILNEGLLIYRVAPYRYGNAYFDGSSYLDEVYLYRPDSYPDPYWWGEVYTNGELEEAPFNPTNGRTEFNSTTNPYPFTSYGYEENEQNINNIHYDETSDSYSFFYGDPVNRHISVNETEILIGKYLGNSGSVAVTSNVLWYVSIPEIAKNWLSSSEIKGLNNKTVVFTALTSNGNETPRSTNVAITGNGQTFYVTVIQEGGATVPAYVITVSADPEAGGTVTGGGTYNEDENVIITATENTNYIFVSWTSESIIISTNPIHSFSAIKDAEFVANFELKESIDLNKNEKTLVFYAQNAIHIKNLPPNTLVQITDLIGRVLYENILTEDNIPFALKGVYVVVLKNSTVSVHKIVVP